MSAKNSRVKEVDVVFQRKNSTKYVHSDSVNVKENHSQETITTSIATKIPDEEKFEIVCQKNPMIDSDIVNEYQSKVPGYDYHNINPIRREVIRAIAKQSIRNRFEQIRSSNKKVNNSKDLASLAEAVKKSTLEEILVTDKLINDIEIMMSLVNNNLKKLQMPYENVMKLLSKSYQHVDFPPESEVLFVNSSHETRKGNVLEKRWRDDLDAYHSGWTQVAQERDVWEDLGEAFAQQ